MKRRTSQAASVRAGLARDLREVVELGTRALEERAAALLRRVHERAELVQDALGERALVGWGGDAETDVAERQDAQRFGEDVPRALVQLEVRGFD